MKDENSICNQLALCRTIKHNIDNDVPMDKLVFGKEDLWSFWGYLHALEFVYGNVGPKFDKEDV